MRRFALKHLCSAALLTFGALASTSGCVDNDTILFIQGAVSSDSAGCTPQADPSNMYLPYGVLDTALTGKYTAFLLVGSQLVTRGSRNEMRTEPNRVTIRDAVVSLSAPGGAGGEFAFTTTATGFIDPSSGEAPGYGLVAVDLIPGASNVQLGGQPLTGNGQVLASVRVTGDTIGGTSITSSEFIFPIQICSGCLVSFPADALKDPTVTNRCTGDPPTDKPCIVGQDVAVDCRLCSGNPACAPPASLLNP
ncbi:MAG: hypothetical protein OZ921_10350 [Sorangiineae bacterium]|nr:hypothetical protein [Polyangiaceae bacterium]MEB2322907.1 hypothetical protein [Sorangiineae bacterium]